MEIPKEKLVRMYELMFKIRSFEEKVAYLNRYTDELHGQIMTCEGSEAVYVGVCMNLRKDDYVLGSHRSNGQLIAKGGDVKKMMAEIYGKETGYCKGRGGQMHYQAPNIGFVTASGVVGDQIPIATGVGLSIKLRGTDQVCVCFFSDGASNTGAFHEGINMAALWKLPVIFVIDNNQYAVSTHVSISTPIENLADRAVAYGIPGVIVDGMDVIEVYKAAKEAVERARRGEGPTLIECKTYRLAGQSALDPGYGIAYRSKEEIEYWWKKCPVKRFRNKLLEMGVLTEEEIKEIEERVKKEIEEAVEFARKSPYPSADTLYDYLYVERG